MRALGLLLVSLAACGKGSSAPAAIATIDGTASFAGKPAKITGCTNQMMSDPHRAATIITLDDGHKFRVDGYEGPRVAKGGGAWEHPDCSRITMDTDEGEGWQKGKLGITCKVADGELVIDATFDCGVKDRGSVRGNRID